MPEKKEKIDSKLYKLKKEKDDEERPENEIKVSSYEDAKVLILNIIKLFKEKDHKTCTITGFGLLVAKTITIAEMVKRRVKGLHQITSIEPTVVVKKWIPREEPKEGEEPLPEKTVETTFTRMIIKLSLDELDKDDIGYQAPLADDEVEEGADVVLPGEKNRQGGGGKGERGGAMRGGRGGGLIARRNEGRGGRGGRGGRDDRKDDRRGGDRRGGGDHWRGGGGGGYGGKGGWNSGGGSKGWNGGGGGGYMNRYGGGGGGGSNYRSYGGKGSSGYSNYGGGYGGGSAGRTYGGYGGGYSRDSHHTGSSGYYGGGGYGRSSYDRYNDRYDSYGGSRYNDNRYGRY